MTTRVEILKTNLKKQQNPISSWNITNEALRHAAHYGHMDVIKFLITETDININWPYEDGRTALIYACIAGNIDIARFLIQNAADVNAQTASGLTALMWACKIGKLDIAELLVTEGEAEIFLQDENGDNAIQFARASEHPHKEQLIKLLVTTIAEIKAHNEISEALSQQYKCYSEQLNVTPSNATTTYYLSTDITQLPTTESDQDYLLMTGEASNEITQASCACVIS